jgi:hypothetical protein
MKPFANFQQAAMWVINCAGMRPVSVMIHERRTHGQRQEVAYTFEEHSISRLDVHTPVT